MKSIKEEYFLLKEEKDRTEKAFQNVRKLGKNVSPETKITTVEIVIQENIALQVFIEIHTVNWRFPHEFMSYIGRIKTTRFTLKR